MIGNQNKNRSVVDGYRWVTSYRKVSGAVRALVTSIPTEGRIHAGSDPLRTPGDL